jgi:predicted MFS family arabinose efflux permease
MEGHDRGGSVALAWPPPPPVTEIPPPPRAARPRLSIGSIALVVAVALAFADASIVVLALPEIYSELHTTIVGVSWVITAYALVVGIGGLLLAPFARRTNPRLLVVVGLATFAFASFCAGVAHETAGLMLARCLQGAGAALMLGASLPVLAALHGSTAAGRRLWTGAGVAGAVIGPALGGLLTQLFDWRAIFLLQAPVAALALVGVLAHRMPKQTSAPRTRVLGLKPIAADLALAFVGAASVGALFLGVLLVVEVWQYEPLTGALVVSALPAATLLTRRLGRWMSAPLLLIGGIVLIAAGLVALALLPASSPGYLAAALAVFGAGLGFASDVLGPLSIPDDDSGVAANLSVCARHLGLVLGLVAIAPTLATNLDTAADRATLAGTATVLDAQLSVREKVPLAWEIRNVLVNAPDGEVPDLSVAFEKRDVADKPEVAQVQHDLTGAIRDTLTRAFRSSFLIAAGLGALALIPGLLAVRGAKNASEDKKARHRGRAMVLVGLVAIAGGLIATEVAAGASDFGSTELVDPCTAPPSPYDGDGIDGAIQRIALGGLNGAACDLGVGREELVLSLDPNSGVGDIKWDHDTIDDAVKAGTMRAIDDAHDRGTLPGWAASAMKTVVKHAPISWFLEHNPLDNIPLLDKLFD